VRATALAVVAATVACGCSSGPAQVGASEPFRLRSSAGLPAPAFVDGSLPGTLPFPDGGQPVPQTDGGYSGVPLILSLSPPSYVLPGASGAPINGVVTENAFGIGLELDVGTGYWLFPVGNEDPTTNQPGFAVLGDFAQDIAPGNHVMRAVAFDEQGNPGYQRTASLCVESRVPDDFNSCLPKDAPPNAVISLTWGEPVDLDLQVLTPSGRLIEPKHPLITQPNDAGVLPKKVDGIDRDSDASCNIDGINTENLVFNATVPHGSYGIYVNMYSACGQPVVHFKVSVYSVVGSTNKHLALFYQQGGVMLAQSANGGTARGLYISQFVFK